MQDAIELVWLKRDLRIDDNRPLWEASHRGRVVVLYVFEPTLWATPEMDRSHFNFICESLLEVSDGLAKLGGKLAICVGEVPEVFQKIHAETPIRSPFSHEETGNRLTYDRDRRVAKWCKANRVEWKEYHQNGVVRRLRDRNGWARNWQQRMVEPITPRPKRIHVPAQFNWGFPLDTAAIADRLRLPKADSRSGLIEKANLQVGGSSLAIQTLDSFLHVRGAAYQKCMSSPVTSFDACSRLSPYLAWGCISLKTVYQRLLERQSEVRSLPKGTIDSRWGMSLKSFSSRLAWHCHFMQKLEDEPQLEFENLHRGYDGLRENDFNQERFEAWCRGETGYPMVDACMRALHQTSWINFRMRAMLISFASNHLWLHWRPTAVYLAKHFLDFEPGIHFSQCQMQSGTTGINTIRIYSPAKQVLDHDPKGLFIRGFVPELAQVPDEYLAEPQRMPMDLQSSVGCIIGKNYPKSIVDHRSAYKSAREKIYAIRQSASAIAEAKRVMVKHGSRKKRDPIPTQAKKKNTPVSTECKPLPLFNEVDPS